VREYELNLKLGYDVFSPQRHQKRPMMQNRMMQKDNFQR